MATAESVEEKECSPSLSVNSPVAVPVALFDLSESPCVSLDYPATIKCCSWIRGLLPMERDFYEAI